MSESKEVAAVPPRKTEMTAGKPPVGIIPTTIDDVWRISNAFMLAGMVPDSYRGKDDDETKAKLAIGIMKGLEVGMGPATALSTIMIINNRPSIWGDGAVALCQRLNRVADQKTEWTGSLATLDLACAYTIWRVGQNKPYIGEFSVQDAQRAHLWMNPKKQPWCLYPARMIFNRARAFALRDGFSDCLMGLGIAEEVQDIPEAPKEVALSFLDDPEPETASPISEAPEKAEDGAPDAVLAEMKDCLTLPRLMAWWASLDPETANKCFDAYAAYRDELNAQNGPEQKTGALL